MAIAEDLEIAAFLKGQPKKLYIGGRWVEAASGKTFETINPATGEVLARVAEGGAEDIDRAVAAARSSFDRGTWRDLPPAERAKLLWQGGGMIEEAGNEVAPVRNHRNGKPRHGARLASHPDVDKIAFTGSTEVGKVITKASAESNLKRVSLELGGKSPNIVFADADLSRAVSGAFFGIFFNQGQVCSAGSRLFVQEKVYDQTLDELLKTLKDTRIGPGIDPVTQMGPLVSKTQMERVLGYINTGNQEGARLLAGEHPARRVGSGYFLGPAPVAGGRGQKPLAPAGKLGAGG